MRRWTADEARHVETHCAGTADEARAIVGALEEALGELKYGALDHSGDYEPQYMDAQTGRLIDAAESAVYLAWEALDRLRSNVEAPPIVAARKRELDAQEAYNAARFVAGDMSADELRVVDPEAYARIDADARS